MHDGRCLYYAHWAHTLHPTPQTLHVSPKPQRAKAVPQGRWVSTLSETLACPAQLVTSVLERHEVRLPLPPAMEATYVQRGTIAPKDRLSKHLALRDSTMALRASQTLLPVFPAQSGSIMLALALMPAFSVQSLQILLFLVLRHAFA